MSNARQELIIRKGLLKSLLDGTIEIKDLAGINVDLGMARQAYLQGVLETTQEILELVQAGVEPYATTIGESGSSPLVKDVEKTLVTVEGLGYCDLIIFHTSIGDHSDDTYIIVYIDGKAAFSSNPYELNGFGMNHSSHPIFLDYAADSSCVIMLSKRWEFRESISIHAVNYQGNVSGVFARVYVNLLR